MKRPSFHSRHSRSSGFTLVELLVVIGIIAILASVLFPVVGASINAAKRSKASAEAGQLLTSATAYFTEYSLYPVPTTATASQDLLISDQDSTNWKALLYGLCGNINPYDTTTTAPTGAVANARAIAFLTLKATDVDSAGGPLNPLYISKTPSSTSATYFNMALDNDYSNIVGDSGTAQGKLPDFVKSTTSAMVKIPSTSGIAGGVAVWANCNGSATTTNPAFWVHTY